MSPQDARVPRRLTDLGHEVGLHYDVNFLSAFPRALWNELLLEQAALLARLSGAPVDSIAMHQPALNGEDPFHERTGFQNAYDDRFFREMAYVSDSCRAWTDEAWEILSSREPPRRIQLLLHPVNWSEDDRDRVGIFESIHRDLEASVDQAKRELLEKVSSHAAVRAHEARARRRTA